MAVRLIAFDLDGTLLGSDGRISVRTCETLRRAVQHGIHLVAASGRPFKALPAELSGIADIRYAITSNGSSIFSLPEGRRIFGVDMAPETVLRLLAVARQTKFPFEIFIGGTGYTPAAYYRHPSDFGVPVRVNDYVRRTRCPVDDMIAFTEDHLQEIEGLNMIVSDPKAKTSVLNALSEIPHLYITGSVSYYIEMAEGGVCKSAALAHLAGKLGISLHETAAFGDSMNDLDLIKGAGLGIAMANALPDLAAAADDLTLSNDEDGVAHYIEKYFI